MAKTNIKHKRINLQDRFVSLKQIGIAAEYFPDFQSSRHDNWHGHDILEMTLLLSGKLNHLIADEEFDVRPGYLSVIHYGIEHCLITDNRKVELINIYLDPQHHALPALPPELEDIVSTLLPLHPNMGHRHNRIRLLQIDDIEALSTLLHMLIKEQNQQKPYWQQTMLSYLHTFLIHCGRSLQNCRTSQSAVMKGWEVFEKIRREINNNISGSYLLEELAEKAGCSRNYFCTRFREYTGLAPLQYILNRRLHKAMSRLRSTGDKILEIALECGFNDLGHFNRKFKEITGVSPRDYRKQFRQN